MDGAVTSLISVTLGQGYYFTLGDTVTSACYLYQHSKGVKQGNVAHLVLSHNGKALANLFILWLVQDPLPTTSPGVC